MYDFVSWYVFGLGVHSFMLSALPIRSQAACMAACLQDPASGQQSLLEWLPGVQFQGSFFFRTGYAQVGNM